MRIDEWLNKISTADLRKIINTVSSPDVRDAMRNTAVHFFLEELDVVGEFKIPDTKVIDLAKELFAEICIEVLVREGRHKRVEAPSMLKRKTALLPSVEETSSLDVTL